MLFDDEKRRRKDAEDLEKIVKEMEKIIEDAFKNTSEIFSSTEDDFSLKIDERRAMGLATSPELEDIIETHDHLFVTIDLPHATEKTLKIKLKNDILEAKYGNTIKEIKLPVKVKRKFTKSFKNGILDFQFEKID